MLRLYCNTFYDAIRLFSGAEKGYVPGTSWVFDFDPETGKSFGGISGIHRKTGNSVSFGTAASTNRTVPLSTVEFLEDFESECVEGSAISKANESSATKLTSTEDFMNELEDVVDGEG
jgi:hypothetical protein